MMGSADEGSEKAGVGGSIPSLATLFFNKLRAELTDRVMDCVIQTMHADQPRPELLECH